MHPTARFRPVFVLATHIPNSPPLVSFSLPLTPLAIYATSSITPPASLTFRCASLDT
jgi:hypothetical protein